MAVQFRCFGGACSRSALRSLAPPNLGFLILAEHEYSFSCPFARYSRRTNLTCRYRFRFLFLSPCAEATLDSAMDPTISDDLEHETPDFDADAMDTDEDEGGRSRKSRKRAHDTLGGSYIQIEDILELHSQTPPTGWRPV